MTLPPVHDEKLLAEAIEGAAQRLAEIDTLVFEETMKQMSPLHRMSGRERLAFYQEREPVFQTDDFGVVLSNPEPDAQGLIGQPLYGNPYWATLAIPDGKELTRELRDYRDLKREQERRNGA